LWEEYIPKKNKLNKMYINNNNDNNEKKKVRNTNKINSLINEINNQGDDINSNNILYNN